MFSLTTHYPLLQSHLQSHCTLLQCAERGWSPRRILPAPSCSAAPAAPGLSSTGSLLKTNWVCFAHYYLNSRQQKRKNKESDHINPPMRMADSRSLLGSLANFASALLLLCNAAWRGAIGRGRGGGGGPGGGGAGGRGCLGPKCKSPLCGIGGSAPKWKPKAVWVDWGGGMGGPGVGGGGGLQLVCREGKRIMV